MNANQHARVWQKVSNALQGIAEASVAKGKNDPALFQLQLATFAQCVANAYRDVGNDG